MEASSRGATDLAPIVIFVYNRLDHTKQTIEALARNDLANASEVFIYSDAAKTEQGAEKVEAVRQYVDSIIPDSLFRSVTIFKAESNRGLANSVINGVSEIVNRFGKVIVVEDDLVTTPDFLSYMNRALDFYRDDPKIWSISGYSFKMKIPKSYNHDIFLSYRASSWGYATWADRWNTVDWELKEYQQFSKDHKMQRVFNRGGRDLTAMLNDQIEGKIDSWAIRWCYEQSRQDTLTVYPVYSRVKNIGLDGSGTHSKRSKEHARWDPLLNTTNSTIKLENLSVDKRIARLFRARYGTVMSAMVGKGKRLITLILAFMR